MQLDRIAEQNVTWHTKSERAAYYEKVGIAVIGEYARIKTLQPVVAHEVDPDPVRRSHKLTFELVNACADIEKATERALENRPDLQSAWFDIALEKPVAAHQRDEVLQRCGSVYAARGLEPWKYWRRNSHSRQRLR